MRTGTLGGRKVTVNERDYKTLLYRFAPKREVLDCRHFNREVKARCLCSHYPDRHYKFCVGCPLYGESDRCSAIIYFYDPEDLIAWGADRLRWHWQVEDEAQAIRAAVYKDLLAFTKEVKDELET